MKIFCCSDTHGKAPPLPKNVDFFLHAGDIYNQLGGKAKGVSPTDFAQMKNNCRELKAWRRKLCCPTFYVRGNHDTYDFCQLNLEDVSGKVKKLTDNLFLVGIGWSDYVFSQLPCEADLASICTSIFRETISQMKDGDHSIMLTHYPPFIKEKFADDLSPYCEGFNFNVIRKAVDALRPIAVIEGHTHQYNNSIFDYNGITVVNPSPKGMILEIEGNNVSIKCPQ